MSSKNIIILGAVITIAGLLFFIYKETTKPQPGQKLDDLGREHFDIGTTVEYNSNPPTSGNHYADWTKAGAFDSIRDDRNLLHSLEHGYIIMTYKCPGVGSSIFNSPTESTTSAKGNEGDCKQRYDQLKAIFEAKGQQKLIVVPRENLETNYALTAWTRLDKFDDFDRKRIEQFIGAYKNQGPERTME